VPDELDSQPRGPMAEVKRRTAKLILQRLRSLAMEERKNACRKTMRSKNLEPSPVPNQAEGFGVSVPIWVDLPKG
jgi:hypothetical protein